MASQGQSAFLFQCIDGFALTGTVPGLFNTVILVPDTEFRACKFSSADTLAVKQCLST